MANRDLQGSEVSSNDAAEEMPLVSMSTTFYLRDELPSDLVFVSSDGVFFTVLKQMLLSKSDNYFAGLLLQEDCLSFTGGCHPSIHPTLFPIVRIERC